MKARNVLRPRFIGAHEKLSRGLETAARMAPWHGHTKRKPSERAPGMPFTFMFL